MLCVISVWTGARGSSSMGVMSLVWSHRKPSQQNRPQISLPITLQHIFPMFGHYKWRFWPCLQYLTWENENDSCETHIQGQASCSGWAHSRHCPTKAKETLTPNSEFSDIIQVHYTSRNNDKGASPGLWRPAGEPTVLPALPALAKTDKSSSFQPQHNKAILCNTGANFCENCHTDDSASNF